MVIPDELMDCLDEEPIVSHKFLGLSETTKKMHIEHILEVKNPDKRAVQILKLMDDLLKR